MPDPQWFQATCEDYASDDGDALPNRQSTPDASSTNLKARRSPRPYTNPPTAPPRRPSRSHPPPASPAKSKTQRPGSDSGYSTKSATTKSTESALSPTKKTFAERVSSERSDRTARPAGSQTQSEPHSQPSSRLSGLVDPKRPGSLPAAAKGSPGTTRIAVSQPVPPDLPRDKENRSTSAMSRPPPPHYVPVYSQPLSAYDGSQPQYSMPPPTQGPPLYATHSATAPYPPPFPPPFAAPGAPPTYPTMARQQAPPLPPLVYHEAPLQRRRTTSSSRPRPASYHPGMALDSYGASAPAQPFDAAFANFAPPRTLAGPPPNAFYPAGPPALPQQPYHRPAEASRPPLRQINTDVYQRPRPTSTYTTPMVSYEQYDATTYEYRPIVSRSAGPNPPSSYRISEVDTRRQMLPPPPPQPSNQRVHLPYAADNSYRDPQYDIDYAGRAMVTRRSHSRDGRRENYDYVEPLDSGRRGQRGPSALRPVQSSRSSSHRHGDESGERVIERPSGRRVRYVDVPDSSAKVEAQTRSAQVYQEEQMKRSGKTSREVAVIHESSTSGGDTADTQAGKSSRRRPSATSESRVPRRPSHSRSRTGSSYDDELATIGNNIENLKIQLNADSTFQVTGDITVARGISRKETKYEQSGSSVQSAGEGGSRVSRSSMDRRESRSGKSAVSRSTSSKAVDGRRRSTVKAAARESARKRESDQEDEEGEGEKEA